MLNRRGFLGSIGAMLGIGSVAEASPVIKHWDPAKPGGDKCVYLEVDQAGRGRVFVDGKEMSHMVSGVRIDTNVGELTTVELKMSAPVRVKAVHPEVRKAQKVIHAPRYYHDVTSLKDEYRIFKRI